MRAAGQDLTTITEQANSLLASIASRVAGTECAADPPRLELKAERIQGDGAGTGWQRATGGAFVRTYRFESSETAEFWLRFLSNLLAATGLVPSLLRRGPRLVVRVAADLDEWQVVDDELVRLCDLLLAHVTVRSDADEGVTAGGDGGPDAWA